MTGQSLALCGLFFLVAMFMDWKELSHGTSRQKKVYGAFMAVAVGLVVISLLGVKLPSVAQSISKLMGMDPGVVQVS